MFGAQCWFNFEGILTVGVDVFFKIGQVTEFLFWSVLKLGAFGFLG